MRFGFGPVGVVTCAVSQQASKNKIFHRNATSMLFMIADLVFVGVGGSDAECRSRAGASFVPSFFFLLPVSHDTRCHVSSRLLFLATVQPEERDALWNSCLASGLMLFRSCSSCCVVVAVVVLAGYSHSDSDS